MNASNQLDGLLERLAVANQAPDSEKAKHVAKIVSTLMSIAIIEGRLIIKLEKEVEQLKEQLSKK